MQYAKMAMGMGSMLLITKIGLFLGTVPPSVIAIYTVLLFFTISAYRIFSFKMLKQYRRDGRNLHNVLIVCDYFSDGFLKQLIAHKEWGFQIKGLVTDSKKLAYIHENFRIYKREDIQKILDNNVIDEIIYAKKNIDVKYLKELANICDETGIILRHQTAISLLEPAKFELRIVSPVSPLLDTPSNKWNYVLKTILETFVSIFAVTILFPLFVIVGTVIKIDSKGPAFFMQERIGLRGRKFQVFKFRTMKVNAESELNSLMGRNEASGPVFKMVDDPRITRAGKFLRKTGLDELPQLLNVIIGDMSLIGPRPPLEKEVELYERYQLKRLSVKPGITCTWQVVPNRHDVSFEKWVDMDIKYINNWQFKDDTKLFFKTIKTFFVAGGH